jgi:hypothetical protein
VLHRHADDGGEVGLAAGVDIGAGPHLEGAGMVVRDQALDAPATQARAGHQGVQPAHDAGLPQHQVQCPLRGLGRERDDPVAVG